MARKLHVALPVPSRDSCVSLRDHSRGHLPHLQTSLVVAIVIVISFIPHLFVHSDAQKDGRVHL